MERLVQTVLSNAVAAAVLAAVLLPLARLVRRPALTHGLCVLILLKLVSPAVYTVPLRWLPAGGQLAARPILPPASVVEPLAAAPDEDDGPRIVMTVPAVTHEAVRQPPFRLPSVRWSAVLLYAWATGSALYVVAVAFGIRRLRRAVRAATPAPADLDRRVRTLAADLGLSRVPSVWFVPGGMCPMLVTLFCRPRILLPELLWERLDRVQREAVLVHELAHYRRRDHWVRPLELAVAVLYWWHPAAWWARYELREAEEQCCDAWVVWSMPRAVRQYMNTLLEAVDLACNGYRQPAGPPVAVPVLASGMGQFHRLERRLTMIKRREVPKSMSCGGLAAVLGLAALLPLAPTMVRADPSPKTPPEESSARAAKPAREVVPAQDAGEPRGAIDAAPKPKESNKQEVDTAEKPGAVGLHDYGAIDAAPAPESNGRPGQDVDLERARELVRQRARELDDARRRLEDLQARSRDLDPKPRADTAPPAPAPRRMTREGVEIRLMQQGHGVEATDAQSGKTLWRFGLGEDTPKGVLLESGRVVVMTRKGERMALDLKTGKALGVAIDGRAGAGAPKPRELVVGRPEGGAGDITIRAEDGRVVVDGAAQTLKARRIQLRLQDGKTVIVEAAGDVELHRPNPAPDGGDQPKPKPSAAPLEQEKPTPTPKGGASS